MKLIRIRQETFEFEMRQAEKEMLLRVLNLNPLVPEAHYRLSQGGRIPDQEENQHLLDEAIRSQRRAHKKQLQAMLDEPARFAATDTGFRVAFTHAEMEWLLQVLNDVRIGSWLALGSPGVAEQMRQAMDKKLRRQVMVMEIAGGFESCLIQVLNGDEPPEHD